MQVRIECWPGTTEKWTLVLVIRAVQPQHELLGEVGKAQKLGDAWVDQFYSPCSLWTSSGLVCS